MSRVGEPLPVYFRYWGKTSEEGGYHLLPYHCLDVAAVGEVFLRRNAPVRTRLAGMLDISEGALISWSVFFLGLHDIGKFARHFQALQPDLFQALQGEAAELPYVRHDALGELLWRHFLKPYCCRHGYLGYTAQQRGRRVATDSAVDDWLHTVLGHHGRPVSDRGPEIRGAPGDYFPEKERQAAETFFVDWYRHCAVSDLPLPSPERVKRASWWLAGLAVLCDWLGSNQERFAMRAEPMPLTEYWGQALEQAEAAVVFSGTVPSGPAPANEPKALFGEGFQPTPLQTHCLELPLHPGAALYLLEDVTGSGKTEAALILAHRLLAAGAGQGLYFALPSMATANAMFERMGRVYRRLYADGSHPSLVLAHGARRLHEGFRDAIEAYPGAAQAGYGDDTEPAQFRCAAWLADSPKKSLLAEVGVGTVDQAVLGVLPSRHQSLRLFGLLGKVLIVDEVHAYDAYLFRLLTALITFHSAADGSTVLLSATVPHDQRRTLMAAFHEGIGLSAPPLRRTGDQDYPLATCASAQGQEEQMVASRPEVCRRVTVRRVDAVEQVEALMAEAVAEGNCLCWIRNTVHDARAAWRELRDRHPEWAIDLFHARFALGDRLGIERRVLGRFGRDGGEGERRGRILVATPVVEQSLDIDFDELVSDLAPIDLLIQRAGRLRRHRRDSHGNPVEGPDRRGAPTLHLFAPEPLDEPEREWFAGFLPKAARVYDNHAQLWLGLRLLTAQGGFTMPDDARRLIEGVYGEVDPPPGLEQSYWDALGAGYSDGSLADYNTLKLSAQYGDTGAGRWWAEERAPTRLGDSTTVYLARHDGERLAPLRAEGDFPWHLSSVSVLASRIRSAERPAAVSEAEWERALGELPGKGKWGVMLVLDEELRGEALDGSGRVVAVRYCGDEGLLVGDECGKP